MCPPYQREIRLNCLATFSFSGRYMSGNKNRICFLNPEEVHDSKFILDLDRARTQISAMQARRPPCRRREDSYQQPAMSSLCTPSLALEPPDSRVGRDPRAGVVPH